MPSPSEHFVAIQDWTDRMQAELFMTLAVQQDCLMLTGGTSGLLDGHVVCIGGAAYVQNDGRWQRVRPHGFGWAPFTPINRIPFPVEAAHAA